MKRPQLSTTILLVFIQLVGIGNVSGQPNERRPNVLFIALDDLNDWVGSLGGKTGIKTPNIDRLASEGILFTKAYCSAPSCTPSRTSILTGKSPSTTGIYDLIRYHWRDNPILADAVTLPQHFRNHGYRTMGSGKIFHALSWINENYGTNQNDARSWNEYFPSVDQPMPQDTWPEGSQQSDHVIKWQPVAKAEENRVPPYYFDFSPLDIPDDSTSDYQVASWASEQLQQAHDTPFFLAAGFFRPHIPWFVPKKYFDLYPLEDIDLPLSPEDDLEDLGETGRQIGAERRRWHQWLVNNGLWKEALQAYMASVSYADAQIGRILDALANGPNADNTIVILWSDHGFHLGEKQTWEKFTLWEESGRIPLIIKAPGVSIPGSRFNKPVSLLDIYPTLADLCDLPDVEGLDGESLKPYIVNPDEEDDRFVVTTFGYMNHAVRSSRWRYICYEDGSEELYDHDHDSGEFYNLATKKEYEGVKRVLKRKIPKANVKPYRPPTIGQSP